MPRHTSHITQKLKAAATLLLLLLCVCSAVARDTTRVFSKLPWGENLVAGDGYLSYYAYGYDGNRAIKMTGNASIDQSGTLLNSTNLENITIYPSEYLTVTQAEYTKYYYAGGNRIASKIGTGGFEKMTRLCTLDQGPTYNANTLLNFVLYQVTNTTQPPTDEYPVDVCAGYNVSNELLTNPLPTLYITQTNLNFLQANLLQQFRQNLAGGTEAVYYFHSDHLGSASWITSGTGGAVQHLLYLPFGEHFVNEQSTGYNERFTFTGKERDAETGYYYFGARFDNVDLGFMSVDPMSDKYPSMSPYAYCAWNPVKLMDPTGREVEYSSFYDRLLVFLERTFNKGFRMRFNDLKKSTETYVFNNNDEAINKLSTDGEKIFINYSLDSKSKEDGSTVFSLLRHEIEHAVQFEYGEVGFAKNSKGEWKPINADINDELKARDFECGWFNINANALYARWGMEEYNLGTREEKIAELRRLGYTFEDEIWNNRDCDVGKNESVFALKFRKRSY